MGCGKVINCTSANFAGAYTLIQRRSGYGSAVVVSS